MILKFGRKKKAPTAETERRLATAAPKAASAGQLGPADRAGAAASAAQAVASGLADPAAQGGPESPLPPEQAAACGVNALAFLGDAVYEHFIREMLVTGGLIRADRLHFAAVNYVRAESQAEVMRALMRGQLTEAEMAVAKRARNHKTANHSRSADAVDYKLATAFEALLGYLSLSGQRERLKQILTEAVALTDARREEENHEQSR